jgi:DNA-binding transcriptional LysR family regulator
MTKATWDWKGRLGHHVKLRDLHVLTAVVRWKGMAKAAPHLAMSQAAVSESIANLERALGVRLLDRSPQGIEPTVYAHALLKRGHVVFDELRQGIRDIEFLADPTTGELTIGYTPSIADTFLPQIVEQFSKKYPRVVMRADIVSTPSFKFPGLSDRTSDLILSRIPAPTPDDEALSDLNVEVLFDDPWILAASANSQWARRRKIELAELLHEPWTMPPPDTPAYKIVAEAFKTRGLGMPTATLVTYSVDLRVKSSARGRFITVVPKSALRGDDRHALRELAVAITKRPWPIALLTLKNRTLSPVVDRFIECVREVAKPLSKRK